MIDISINGKPLHVTSIEELDEALVRFEQHPHLELWALVPNGPRIAMLRNGTNAWLMYLRFDGDSGFVSEGDRTNIGSASYELANGQVDQYPLSWCIDVDQCYRAVMYFFVNDGARPEWVRWQAS